MYTYKSMEIKNTYKSMEIKKESLNKARWLSLMKCNTVNNQQEVKTWQQSRKKLLRWLCIKYM